MADNSRRGERKRAKMVAFCGHLLAYPTVQQAAEATGISSRSATRWIKSELFKEIYTASRAATLKAVNGLLRASSVGAVETLAAIARDPGAAATARCNAARAILEGMLKLNESTELEERIAELEKLAGGAKN